MKKLIFGTLFLALVGIGVFSCEKNKGISTSTQSESITEKQKNELQSILNSLNSQENIGPGWWEKFKEWVNSKSGSSQLWVNGQPACHGSAGCGPCAGICPFGLVEGGDDGSISDADLNEGFRPLQFTFIENSQNSNDIRLLVEIPSNYVGDFVSNDDVYVAENTYLPEFLVHPLSASSILMKQGIYPAIIDPQSGNAQTIIDIKIK